MPVFAATHSSSCKFSTVVSNEHNKCALKHSPLERVGHDLPWFFARPHDVTGPHGGFHDSRVTSVANDSVQVVLRRVDSSRQSAAGAPVRQQLSPGAEDSNMTLSELQSCDAQHPLPYPKVMQPPNCTNMKYERPHCSLSQS
jgi:hypothetical protein